MRRRTFTAGALALAATPLSAPAQQARARRLAMVANAITPEEMVEGGHPWYVAFFKELRRQGWVEGRNLSITRWSAGGNPDRYDALVDEVVASGPEIIL